MKNWTKEEALQTLQELADEVERLKSSQVFSTEHTLWLTKCHDTLEEVLGLASRYYLSLAQLSWQPTSGTIVDPLRYGGSYEAAIDVTRHQAFLRDLRIAKGILLGAVNFLESREMSEVYKAKDTGPEASLILKVLHLAEHQLRKVIRTQPDKESEVQDAFENLLIGADIPYGREVDSIEYSSKTYKPDFSLPKIGLAVEVKLCRQDRREKEIIAEINDDILAYKSKYPNLIFIVYDLGYIRDKDRFCGSFEEHGNVTVRVVKH
ncbi:hypothetical protein ES708_33059 [subsurface metagenome]